MNRLSVVDTPGLALGARHVLDLDRPAGTCRSAARLQMIHALHVASVHHSVPLASAADDPLPLFAHSATWAVSRRHIHRRSRAEQRVQAKYASVGAAACAVRVADVAVQVEEGIHMVCANGHDVSVQAYLSEHRGNQVEAACRRVDQAGSRRADRVIVVVCTAGDSAHCPDGASLSMESHTGFARVSHHRQTSFVRQDSQCRAAGETRIGD